MDRALNYLALGKKARLIELGEEPVGASARANHARLVVVAADASDHTWRRAKSFVAGTDQQCIRAPYDKAQMGLAVGRTELALAAFTDAAMALAFLKALPAPEQYSAAAESLEKRSQRLQQRKIEAKASQRNKRFGKNRSPKK
ncbi:MAG: 50S ribosomal protein L7 [Ruminococcaceae bacterium]|nr:50S ribosomal protein L7 [Oscillospiraceae bacterium]